MKFEHHCIIDKVSNRDRYIGETSGDTVEGGALNANYRTVEAVAKVSAILGRSGYEYGQDFVWESFDISKSLISSLFWIYVKKLV